MRSFIDYRAGFYGMNIFKHMLRLGTDCSGIDAPLCALLSLLPCKMIKYCFASEKDKYLSKKMQCAEGIKPDIVYNDITTRKHQEAPAVDLYIAGSPCQSFSTTGKRTGLKDTRGIVIFSVIEYIAAQEPTVFIIENVSNLLNHESGKTWDVIWSKMSQDLLPTYHIEYRCISPHELGYPQTRKRVFIIGRHTERLGVDSATSPFPWDTIADPTEAKEKSRERLNSLIIDNDVIRDSEPNVFRPLVSSHQRSLSDVLALAKVKEIYNDMFTKPYIVRLGVSSSFIRTGTYGMAPCLTQRSENLYIPSKGRYLSSKEALMLQGFPEDYGAVKDFNIPKIFRTTGNAMHVGVMKHLIARLLRIMNVDA